MILSGKTIKQLVILEPCIDHGVDNRGCSVGLSGASYDLRIAEDLWVLPGQFYLTSSIEYFSLPPNVAGRVCDKSTLARQRLRVQNTFIDPGFRGFLTLEIDLHPTAEALYFYKGDAVAQVVFEMVDIPSEYSGKYQDQEAGGQKARNY